MVSSQRLSFYKSKLWKQVKNNVWLKQYCLCAECNRPVYVDGITDWIPKEKRLKGIVHHKEYLHSYNLNDDDIAINEDNLVGLCVECHNHIHGKDNATRKEVKFDDYGNLIKK